MYSSEPLPHLVEHYLAYLHEVYPTAACFDGVHTHDDLLEDFSRSAIDAHLREIGSFERRLAAIDPESLTPVQRVERPILEAHIRAKIHDLDAVRAWERNPLLYAETLALSLAAQVLFAYAPAAERARRILSKLRQTPRLIQSARENVKDPPGIFVKTAVERLSRYRAARTSSASSQRAARASSARVAPGRPASCNPAGRPGAASPIGSVIAGWPVRLNTCVRRSVAFRTATRWPSISTVDSPSRGAGTGSVGSTSASTRSSSASISRRSTARPRAART